MNCILLCISWISYLLPLVFLYPFVAISRSHSYMKMMEWPKYDILSTEIVFVLNFVSKCCSEYPELAKIYFHNLQPGPGWSSWEGLVTHLFKSWLTLKSQRIGNLLITAAMNFYNGKGYHSWKKNGIVKHKVMW